MSTAGSADAVVIGAGVVGASIALALQQGGRDVIVVDKGPSVGGASTSASASVVRFTYSTRAGVIAAWESALRWRVWAEHVGPLAGPLARFHQVGMLLLLSPGDDLDRTTAHFDALGLAYEYLDAAGIAGRFPALDTGRYHPPRLATDPGFFGEATGEVKALWQADAGFVDDPQLAALNLMDGARRCGTRVRLATEVVRVSRSQGRVSGVVLDGGDSIDTPVVVNAAGPWSSLVNRMAGVEGDMRIGTAALGQDVAGARAPTGFGVGRGGTVVGDLDLGAYYRPQPGGSFLVGGVEAGCDPFRWVSDPDADDPSPDPDRLETLLLRAARRIPAFEIPRQPRGLRSHYDVSDDWVPIYDRSVLPGFYLAVGTSGNQFKNAPVIGEIMATIVDGCQSGHDHDAEPLTLHCGRSGFKIDLGEFSRLREPVATSGTVLG